MVGSGHDSLPSEAWAAALAGLPNMGPARLLALLLRWSPERAWHRVRAASWSREPSLAAAMGRASATLSERWSAAAAAIDVDAQWARYIDARVGVATVGSGAFPAALA